MKIKATTLLVSLYSGILALLPFTWWSSNLHLVGGDDIKYEYIDPGSKLATFFSNDLVMLSGSESGLIHEVSGFPFYLILTIIHNILPFLNTQQLVNAFVLAGSFVAFFWMTSTVPAVGKAQGNVPVFVRFVAANVYALSTVNIVTLWSHQLPVFVYMATLPLIFGLFMRSATKYSAVSSVSAALVLALSPSPYAAVPWLLPVFICSLPLVVALTIERPWDALKTFIMFSLATVVLLFPTWVAMSETAGYSQGMFASNQVKESVRTFIELNKNNSLVHPIALMPNEWLLGNLPLYREAPWLLKGALFIFAAMMLALAITSIFIVGQRKNGGYRMMFTGVLLSWGFSVVLYTGGGVKILFSLLTSGMEAMPLLSMFRNNYDKFGMAISLFSGIMIFYSLVLIYSLQNPERVDTK